MKLPETTTTTQSTMDGEKVMMGISAEDMSHIMGILAGLYKDRLLAMIREYSCNAWDSHVEAGFCGPIEVTLPSSLAPTLKIRDYGSGLSAEDIREVYSQYGRSTKRNTNDQVGMMGLGSKSALSYTQQFTVVSVKDGERVTVLIALDADGVGTMQILSVDPCEDANGTEVQIAIKREDIYTCSRTSDEFFQYWDTDAVLVNGKPPARFKALKLSDNLYMREAPAHESRIIMGNVVYPHAIDVYNGKRTYSQPDIALIAFVPIGSVKPTPSRESLMDVQITKNTVTRIRAEYRNNIATAAQREIDACATHQEAIEKITTWRRFLPKGTDTTYTYRGTEVPEGFVPTVNAPRDWKTDTPYVEVARTQSYYGSKAESDYYTQIDVDRWPTMLWVEDFEPMKFTVTHKNKLAQWCGDNSISVSGYALMREPVPKTPFIDSKMIVPWETIKTIKLVKTTTYSGRIPGSYDFHTEAGALRGHPGSEIRQDELICWYGGNIFASRNAAKLMTAMFPKFTLVCLGENRVAKFQRDVPAARPWRDVLTERYKKWQAGISEADLEAIAMCDAGVAEYYRLLGKHGASIDDPRINTAIQLANRDVKALISNRKKFGAVVEWSDDTKFDDPINIESYPLLGHGSYSIYRDPDVVIYLNAKYALTKTAPTV